MSFPPAHSELLPLLPYLPLLLLAAALLKHIYTLVHDRLYTDLHAVPTPPLPPHRAFTVGHNLLYVLLRSPALDTAARFSAWRANHGELIKLRSLFGTPAIFAMSASAVRTICTSREHAYIKPQVTHDTLAPLIGHNGILLVEGPAHTRLRKAVAPSMHHHALLALGHVFLREGLLLSKRLSDSQERDEVDILRDVRIGTFTVILETCFGSNRVSKDVADRLQDAYLEAFLEPPSHVLKRVLCQKLLWFLPKHWFGWRERLKAYIRNTVYDLCDDHTFTPQPGATGKALLSLIVDEQTKKAISRVELVETVLSFLTAGQATTSMSVCWLFYLLAKESEWQDRVLAELSEGWAEGDGLDVLDRLPVLERVIKECLRLYPPVFNVSRELAEDDVLDGYRLPKGTNVRIPVLAIQRDENIWGADAATFNPDRFLDAELVARTRAFWLPFIQGPRGCIGQRFALLEIKAFAAQVLMSKRCYIKPLEDPSPSCYGLFATPRGMKVYFEPRSGFTNEDIKAS